MVLFIGCDHPPAYNTILFAPLMSQTNRDGPGAGFNPILDVDGQRRVQHGSKNGNYLWNINVIKDGGQDLEVELYTAGAAKGRVDNYLGFDFVS